MILRIVDAMADFDIVRMKVSHLVIDHDNVHLWKLYFSMCGSFYTLWVYTRLMLQLITQAWLECMPHLSRDPHCACLQVVIVHTLLYPCPGVRYTRYRLRSWRCKSWGFCICVTLPSCQAFIIAHTHWIIDSSSSRSQDEGCFCVDWFSERPCFSSGRS